MVQAERDQLLREKMSVLRNMMIADRIVSLGLLAAGLSHHIRNSLVAVKTFLDLAPVKMAEEKTALCTACATPISGRITTRTSSRRSKKSTPCSSDLWTASSAIQSGAVHRRGLTCSHVVGDAAGIVAGAVCRAAD